MIGLLSLDPAGKDAYEIVSGNSIPPYLREEYLNNSGAKERTIQIFTGCADPGGAGEFLQQQSALQNGPVRYFGYDAINLRTEDLNTDQTMSYHGAQSSATIQAILVGTRATCLGLYDLQGYSPVQVERYWEFLQAVNGTRLDYHDAVILTSGFNSPLLSLLNPAYVIIPSEIPANRPDLQQVAETMPEVFANEQVRVFANTKAMPHAWIVHEAQSAPRDQVLDLLTSGTIDLRASAVIEGDLPALVPAGGSANETVSYAAYEPDRMEMRVDAASDGLLVLSEVYNPGWTAYVDGERAEIVPTNYVLRGVAVPAGSHTVELRYEPDSLQIGLWISSITAIALVGVALAAAWQSIRSRRAVLRPATDRGPALDAPVEDFEWARRIEAAMEPPGPARARRRQHGPAPLGKCLAGTQIRTFDVRLAPGCSRAPERSACFRSCTPGAGSARRRTFSGETSSRSSCRSTARSRDASPMATSPAGTPRCSPACRWPETRSPAGATCPS